MSKNNGHSITGRPVPTAKQEEQAKGSDQRDLKERLGQRDHEASTHPEAHRTGVKGGSNVGEDSSSGDE